MAVLKKGSKAPNFKAKDQDGNPISLSDFKGKKVVLYFYPHDDTPTCTIQACNLRDNYALLQKKGYQVVGVSVDGVASHRKFADKYDLPFPLVSDEDKKIVDKYNLWGQKQMMGRTFMGTFRTTFLIDEEGKIVSIIDKPVSKDHTEEVLQAWKDAGY